MIQSVLPEINRRNFLGRAVVALGGLSALNICAGLSTGCSTKGNPLATVPRAAVEEQKLSWQTVLVSKEEPGTPLVVSGKIFKADGKTPAGDLTIYVYHTDARGLYSEEDGNGREPNPRLKGWMQTDREGRYEFRTIKPAPYPNSRNRAHIHSKVYGGGQAELRIEDFVFEDDPLVPSDVRARFANQGTFSPVMKVERDGALLRCVRDIRLVNT
jgi:protocatechuate 3,4-dioxygenase beta subunit